MKCLFLEKRENEIGIHNLTQDFNAEIGTSDLIVVLAEHNGAYIVAFKNILN